MIPSSCDQIMVLKFPILRPTASPIQTLPVETKTYEMSLTGLNLLEHTPHPDTGHIFNYTPIDHWISYENAEQLSQRRRVLGQLDFIPSFSSPPLYVVIDSTDDVPRVVYRRSERRTRSTRSLVVPIDRITGGTEETNAFLCIAGDFTTPAPQVTRRITSAADTITTPNALQATVQVISTGSAPTIALADTVDANAVSSVRDPTTNIEVNGVNYPPLFASLWMRRDREVRESSSQQPINLDEAPPEPSLSSSSSSSSSPF